jgi:hypothetical protein
MLRFVAALLFLGAFQASQQPKLAAADAPPAVTVSQAPSILMLEHQRLEIEPQQAALQQQLNQLDGRLASVMDTDRRVVAEFAQQHPGWHLDAKTFQPTRDTTAPTSQGRPRN